MNGNEVFQITYYEAFALQNVGPPCEQGKLEGNLRRPE